MVPTMFSGIALIQEIGVATLMSQAAKVFAAPYGTGTKILMQIGAAAITTAVGSNLSKTAKDLEEKILVMQEKAVGLDVIGVIE